MSPVDAQLVGEDILVLRTLKRRVQDDLNRLENIMRLHLSEAGKLSIHVGSAVLRLVPEGALRYTPRERKRIRRDTNGALRGRELPRIFIVESEGVE